VIDKSEAANKKIQNIHLPEGYQIIAVFRNKELTLPGESLWGIVLKPGDEAIIYTTNTKGIDRVSEIFTKT